MHKASVNVPQSIFFCRVGGQRVPKNNHIHFLMHFKPKPSSSTKWKVPTQQVHKNAGAETQQPKGRTMHKDCGLTPAGSSALHTPSVQTGSKQGQNWKCKSEKTQGWRLRRFHRESTSHHPLPPSAVCSPSPRKAGLSQANSALEDKCCNSKQPPSSFFS